MKAAFLILALISLSSTARAGDGVLDSVGPTMVGVPGMTIVANESTLGAGDQVANCQVKYNKALATLKASGLTVLSTTTCATAPQPGSAGAYAWASFYFIR